MACKNRGIYGVFGSVVGPEYLQHMPPRNIRVLAIYLIMLGWKTSKYYYETDELPHPRPTQPKKQLG